MKKLLSLCICLTYYFLSMAQQVYNIDISKAIYKDIPMNEILADIDTIHIKMPDSLKFRDGIVELTNDRKFLIVSNPIDGPYMFDIKGNFIKVIKSLSIDHNGTDQKLSNSHFDKERNIFYEDFFDRWVGTDVQTGRVVKQVFKPELLKNRLASFMQMKENEYIGYNTDVIRGGNSQLLFFDSCGTVLKHEPELEPYTYGSRYPQGPFKENNSRYYFIDPYLGTKVYKIIEHQLIPYIYCHTDNNKLSNFVETKERIYFCISTDDKPFWGYYSKKENQAYIASNSLTPIKFSKLDEKNFFPSFVQGLNSVTSKLEGNTLKVIIGTFK